MATGEGSVAIAMADDFTAPPVVDWWQKVGADSTDTRGASVPAVPFGSLWVAELNDLPVGPLLGYRVRSDRGNSPDYEFRTGRKPGESFRFAAFGDTRTGHKIHQAVINAVSREHIDFFMHSGDMVHDNKLRDK